MQLNDPLIESRHKALGKDQQRKQRPGVVELHCPRPGFDGELPSGLSLMVRVPHHDPEHGRRVRDEDSRTEARSRKEQEFCRDQLFCNTGRLSLTAKK